MLTKRRTEGIITELGIKGQRVETKVAVKYLRIYLDTGLTFRKHIQDRIVKASSAIRTLYPMLSMNSKVSRENKILIY